MGRGEGGSDQESHPRNEDLCGRGELRTIPSKKTPHMLNEEDEKRGMARVKGRRCKGPKAEKQAGKPWP